MHNNSVNRQKLDQQGIVSLVVTVILMIVLSLIVVSFARTSRRAQRDALDRQLSTSAFYAAESGVNDARKALDANASLLNNSYTEKCTGNRSFAEAAGLGNLPSTEIGATGSNAHYTCLFVNPVVSDIQHGRTSDPYAFMLKKDGNGSLGELVFYWDAGETGTTSYDNCPSVGSNLTDWPAVKDCASGVLRIELTEDMKTSKVFFVYPAKGNSAGNINFNAGTTGSTVKASCSSGATPRECQVKVNLGTPNPVYTRVSSLYKDFALTVQSNASDKFSGGQVMIDSNGRAGDVQRRIQVRYTPGLFGGPLYALQSGASTCKKFTIDGTSATDMSSPSLCWPKATYGSTVNPDEQLP